LVALSSASVPVFVSSKVTTASAFSRLTSAFVTPSILVNDLFTEISHDTHVIPDTESVTVLVSAKAAAETTANRIIAAALMSLFMVSPSVNKRDQSFHMVVKQRRPWAQAR